MKGLLIKDFKLMKAQRNFFIFIIVIAIGMAMSTEDSSFIIGYMTFVGLLFTMSTISYDEFENGNYFLFSLPITRKGYTAEKYGFGLIVGGISWLFATVVCIIAMLAKGSGSIMDTTLTAFLMLPILLVIFAIMLPFQLKYGGEKGRIAMIGAIGLMVVIGILAVRIAKVLNIDLIRVFDNLPTISMRILIAIMLGIAIVILFLSYRISVAIMNKKEF